MAGTNFGTLFAKLDLDTMSFTAGMAAADAAMATFQKTTKTTNLLLGNLGVAFSAVGIGHIVSEMIQAGEEMTALNRRLTVMTASLRDTAKEFEGYKDGQQAVQLANQKTSETFDYLRSTAMKSGTSFETLSKTYSQLLPSAASVGVEINTIRKAIEGTIGATHLMGSSNQEVASTFYAMREIVSKNQVMMKEMRQQLENALPNSLLILANGMTNLAQKSDSVRKSIGLVGAESIVTTAKLNQLIHEGKIDAQLFMEAWAEGTDAFKQFSALGQTTVGGQMQNMKTILSSNVGSFMQDSGANFSGAAIMSSLNAAIDDFTKVSKERADEIGGAFYDAFKKTGMEVAKFFDETIRLNSALVAAVTGAFKTTIDGFVAMKDALPSEVLELGLFGIMLFGVKGLAAIALGVGLAKKMAAELVANPEMSPGKRTAVDMLRGEKVEWGDYDMRARALHRSYPGVSDEELKIGLRPISESDGTNTLRGRSNFNDVLAMRNLTKTSKPVGWEERVKSLDAMLEQISYVESNQDPMASVNAGLALIKKKMTPESDKNNGTRVRDAFDSRLSLIKTTSEDFADQAAVAEAARAKISSNLSEHGSPYGKMASGQVVGFQDKEAASAEFLAQAAGASRTIKDAVNVATNFITHSTNPVNATVEYQRLLAGEKAGIYGTDAKAVHLQEQYGKPMGSSPQDFLAGTALELLQKATKLPSNPLNGEVAAANYAEASKGVKTIITMLVGEAKGNPALQARIKQFGSVFQGQLDEQNAGYNQKIGAKAESAVRKSTAEKEAADKVEADFERLAADAPAHAKGAYADLADTAVFLAKAEQEKERLDRAIETMRKDGRTADEINTKGLVYLNNSTRDNDGDVSGIAPNAKKNMEGLALSGMGTDRRKKMLTDELALTYAMTQEEHDAAQAAAQHGQKMALIAAKLNTERQKSGAFVTGELNLQAEQLAAEQARLNTILTINDAMKVQQANDVASLENERKRNEIKLASMQAPEFQSAQLATDKSKSNIQVAQLYYEYSLSMEDRLQLARASGLQNFVSIWTEGLSKISQGNVSVMDTFKGMLLDMAQRAAKFFIEIQVQQATAWGMKQLGMNIPGMGGAGGGLTVNGSSAISAANPMPVMMIGGLGGGSGMGGLLPGGEMGGASSGMFSGMFDGGGASPFGNLWNMTSGHQAGVNSAIDEMLNSSAATSIAGSAAESPGFWSGLMSMFAFHDGGFVGTNSGLTRNVSGSVFGGAPKFHEGGLVRGEVPIIAKEGEAVFTPKQMDNADSLLQSAMNSGNNGPVSQNVTVNMNAPGGEPAHNQDLANKVAAAVAVEMKKTASGEIRTQMRPGGMLNQMTM